MNQLSYAGRMLVRCPSCDAMAVATRGDKMPQEPIVVRAACTHCGFAKEWRTKGDGTWRQEPGLELWLQTDCAGHRLWAFNEEHLDFLRRYVAATLRERATFTGWDGEQHVDKYYGRIPAALPTWMKLAKHRGEVLAAIERLAGTMTG